MLLILLLILSQDAGFVTACQTSILSSVPWYKDRLLGKISVGSLMVIVLVRTVQTNLAGVHDSYVHTNCLAALANIAGLRPRESLITPHDGAPSIIPANTTLVIAPSSLDDTPNSHRIDGPIKDNNIISIASALHAKPTNAAVAI